MLSSLSKSIKDKNSFLCVGLDSDIEKIPAYFKRHTNPVLAFNKAVIDATKDFCVSYKINTAFYERLGTAGWEIMEKTLDHIPTDQFVIADAKRGDIGNTARQYAKAFFETMGFDAITLNPYMGMDTLDPFLTYDDKTVIVLGLTSNKGSAHFENQRLANGKMVYEQVIEEIVAYAPVERTQFVVGATHPEEFKSIRKIAPNNFLLVPGVGAQGGDLEAVYQNGSNNNTGLLINVSRGVIFAGNDSKNPSKEIIEAAKNFQGQMKKLLNNVE